jgi:hypothetical protein
VGIVIDAHLGNTIDDALASGGRRRMLVGDGARKERIREIYAEMASAKPVGRAQRFRPAQQKKQ